MSSFSDPYRPPWSAGRRTIVRDSELRVSDAERREVADALAEQYGEGRLDQAELEERVEVAMAAKTRGDLAGLLADFPRPEGRPEPLPQHRHGPGRLLVVAFVVLAVLASTSMASAFYRPHVPWLLVAVVLFVLLRRGHHRGRGSDRLGLG